MANFTDLPKPVRERIYGLHLTRDEPITLEEHSEFTDDGYNMRDVAWMPPLLKVSDEIDEQAAPFYYADNRFVLKTFEQAWRFRHHLSRRHKRLVQKIICVWNDVSTSSTEMFDVIRSFKALSQLHIRVNELEMVKQALRKRNMFHRAGWWLTVPTPQQQQCILQYPGIPGLLRLSGIQEVKFVEDIDREGKVRGGPVSGGVLESQVAPKLMAPRIKNETSASKQATARTTEFPFLRLTPELRNRVYHLLLRFNGPLHLTNQPPKPSRSRAIPMLQHSALSILAANRQIHDEACGIFYHRNTLTFEWTTHLLGFLHSIGPARRTSVRQLKIRYLDVKSGGMSLVDLTWPLLKNLKGLRKLEITLQGQLADKVFSPYWDSSHAYMTTANPCLLPGMKILLGLRGITDISVRDETLEERVEALKKGRDYPDFVRGTANACLLKVYQALQHFNEALKLAQRGKLRHDAFTDDMWHSRDKFPALEVDESKMDEQGQEAVEGKEEGKKDEHDLEEQRKMGRMRQRA